MDSRIGIAVDTWGDTVITAVTAHGEGSVRVRSEGLSLIGVFASNPVLPAVAGVMGEALQLADDAWRRLHI
ncbi:hypothetical protein [Nocardia niwae]|uniref:hypothetical protein n=1 Tax=Nocardia niwae TaxID=626084 RepID=UPI0033DD356C